MIADKNPPLSSFERNTLGYIYKPSFQNDPNQNLSYISSCVRKSTEAASNYCWDLHSNIFPASCVVACPNHCIPSSLSWRVGGKQKHTIITSCKEGILKCSMNGEINVKCLPPQMKLQSRNFCVPAQPQTVQVYGLESLLLVISCAANFTASSPKR